MENLLNLFEECKTLEDVKKVYKKYAFKFHPDREGGSTEKMQALNAAYEKAFKIIESGSTFEDDKKHGGTMKEYAEKVNELIKIVAATNADITIELCGTWLWISGNTYPVKNELKAIGCKWQSVKKMWYIKPADSTFTKRYKKNVSMEEIRSTYGSEIIDIKKKAPKQLESAASKKSKKDTKKKK